MQAFDGGSNLHFAGKKLKKASISEE